MAVPAIIGLASLGGLVSKLIEKIVDFFISRVGKKIAIITTVIAALYVAVGVLLATIGTVLDPLLSALPPAVTSIMGAALPSNTTACLSAIIATEIACITYSLTVKALDIQSKVA